jgi:hypothetical protein
MERMRVEVSSWLVVFHLRGERGGKIVSGWVWVEGGCTTLLYYILKKLSTLHFQSIITTKLVL